MGQRKPRSVQPPYPEAALRKSLLAQNNFGECSGSALAAKSQCFRIHSGRVSDGARDEQITECRPQSNSTPIRFSARRTMWHCRLSLSLWMYSTNLSGIKSGVTTSKAAPLSQRFLTVQSTAPPPNSMVPAFRRCDAVWRNVFRSYSSANRESHVEVPDCVRVGVPALRFVKL
jgi:hypothetical protein